MKTKIIFMLLSFAVLSALLISCVTISFSEDISLGNIDNNSKVNSQDNISTSTPEISFDTSRAQNGNSNSDIIDIEPPTSQSMDWSSYTAAECDDYFKDSVFVGDSVMSGFKDYVAIKRNFDKDFLSNAKFHAGGSYSVYNALQPVSNDSVHPIYAGRQTAIEDALPLLGAKKVFVFFGVNDIGLYGDGSGPEKTVQNYEKLFSRIRQKSPDIEIVVLSATYLYKDYEMLQRKKYAKINLTSENLRKFNQLMLEYCGEHDIDYIDVSTAVSTDEGYLAPKYCSDQQFHLNSSAYDVWMNIFRAYAADKMDENYKNVISIVDQFN